MSVTSIIDKIMGLQKQRSQAKINSYREMVAGIAAGEEPNPVEVDRLLAEAGKSIEDLSRDVDRYQSRMENKALVASLPSIEREFEQVQHQIAIADRDLEEAESKHTELTAPLYFKLDELKNDRNEASKALQELFHSCDDPELLRQYKEVTDEINRLAQANKNLAEQAVYLDSMADSELNKATKEAIESDRIHRREQAAHFKKQSQSIGRQVNENVKAQAEAFKRRDQIEQRMRAW